MEKEINGKCYICGKPLIWNEGDDLCCFEEDMDCEGTVIKSIICSNCGTLYENYIGVDNTPDNEENHIDCQDQGFGRCIHCGGNLVWGSDFMRSDFNADLADTDKDSLVRTLTCGHCGCGVEVTEPSEFEIKNSTYKYWQDNKKEYVTNE